MAISYPSLRDNESPTPSDPADEYLHCLRRSGLVPFEKLTDVIARFGQDAEGKVRPPKELGEQLVAAGLLTQWQHNKLCGGKYEGFVIGRYLLLSHIANGGIAAVFEARHVETGQKVAIKILLPELTSKTSYLERFEREATAAQLLKHPNVLQVLDVGCVHYATTGPLHYMVAEYFENKNLMQTVQERGPLPVDVAAEYIRQAAKGLSCAHGNGIVHRNLKPNNLVVDGLGQVRITNLGVARFLNEEDAESLTLRYQEKVIGTAAFMAPEQVVNSHKVDARSDLYSLGGIFYYLLTGKAPFEGVEGVALMLKQLHDQPKALNKVRNDVPPQVQAVCEKLLAKEPEKRYESAAQVADALSNWLLGSGIGWARRVPVDVKTK